MTASNNDQILFQRAAQGDKNAFAELYHQHLQAVRAFLLIQIGHPQAVEDISQEVFARAWQGAARYKGESSVKTYLIGIAKNILREMNGSVRTYSGNLPQLLLSQQDTDASARSSCLCDCPECPGMTDDEARLCREDLKRIVIDALESLPPLSHEAIELTIFRQMGIADAAIQIGCSTKVFRERLYSGIRKLRSAITERLKRTEGDKNNHRKKLFDINSL